MRFIQKIFLIHENIMKSLFSKFFFLVIIFSDVFAKKKPNIVFILADDLGYGDPHTARTLTNYLSDYVMVPVRVHGGHSHRGSRGGRPGRWRLLGLESDRRGAALSIGTARASVWASVKGRVSQLVNPPSARRPTQIYE